MKQQYIGHLTARHHPSREAPENRQAAFHRACWESLSTFTCMLVIEEVLDFCNATCARQRLGIYWQLKLDSRLIRGRVAKEPSRSESGLCTHAHTHTHAHTQNLRQQRFPLRCSLMKHSVQKRSTQSCNGTRSHSIPGTPSSRVIAGGSAEPP